MATILITGGTGLVGKALTKALIADGHSVRHLSRKPEPDAIIPAFEWDPVMARVDPAALKGAEHIVHLAGAPIADRRWSDARVRELIASRAGTARLLLRAAGEQNMKPRSFVSAAGIGFYGAMTSDHIFTENDPAATDTIGRISSEWEEAVDEWASECRVVKLRAPIVLAREGPLRRIARAVRWGSAAPFGTGRQHMPWVHIDDLVRAYQQAIFGDTMSGAYNVCAAEQPTNREFMRALAHVLHRPFFLPAVPGILLRLALGELAEMLLQGSRISSERLLATGFRFRYDRLSEAFDDLFRVKH